MAAYTIGLAKLIITRGHKYDMISDKSSTCIVFGVCSRSPDFKGSTASKKIKFSNRMSI